MALGLFREFQAIKRAQTIAKVKDSVKRMSPKKVKQNLKDLVKARKNDK